MRNEDNFDSESETFPAGETPRVGRAARKVRQGLGELGRALGDRRENIVEPVADFIQAQPLAAIGIAFGIGYVLAGGLFSRTTGRILGLGWRLGGMALARNMLSGLGGDGQDL